MDENMNNELNGLEAAQSVNPEQAAAPEGAQPQQQMYNQQQGYYDPNQMQYQQQMYNQQQGYYDPNQMQYQQQMYNQQQGYYDPNQMQYQQQMYNQQNPQNPYPGMMHQPAANPYHKEKKTFSKKKVAIMAVALVTCALAAIAFALFKKTNETIISDAMSNTVSSFKSSSIFSDALGIADYSETDTDLEFDISINEIAGTAFEGLDISADVAIDNQDSDTDWAATIAVTADGEPLSITFTELANVLYMEIPDVYDEVITMDVAGMLDSVEVDSSASSNGASALYQEYVGTAQKSLKNSIKYNKVGKVTYTDSNGDTVKAKQYDMTVPVSQLVSYLRAYRMYVNAYMDQYVGEDYLDAFGLSIDEIDEFLAEYISTFEEYCTEDFVISFYVKKGNAVRVSMDYTMEVQGIPLDFTSVIDFMGDDVVTDDTHFAMKATATDDGETHAISLTGDISLSEIGNTTTKYVDMILYIDGETAIYSASSSLDLSSLDFSGDLAVRSNGETLLGWSYDGTLTNVSKGVSFEANVSNFTFVMGDTTICDLSGSVAFGDLNKSVTVPTGTLVSYEELENLEVKTDAVTDFISALAGVDVSDQVEDDDYDYDYDYDYSSIFDEEDYDTSSDDVEEADDLADDTADTATVCGDSNKITLKCPNGFYFYELDSEEYAYIYCDDSMELVGYMIVEGTSSADVIAATEDMYEPLYDGSETIVTESCTVTNSDGTTMDCFYALTYVDSSYYIEICYAYPISSEDFVYVQYTCFYVYEVPDDLEAYAQDIADMVANTSVIVLH